MNQASDLSLRSENTELEKFRVGCIQEIRDKLALITIPTDWLVWIPTDNCVRFFCLRWKIIIFAQMFLLKYILFYL